ncbi:MAG: DoxX family protein [Acidobacteriia bacterium]|nr:DoxX family protein [Terriglobia bacterium]
MATDAGRMVMASRKSREAGRGIVVLYWIFTLLLVAHFSLTAITLILRVPMITALVRHLGYPEYFPVLLGVAKILGIVAILQPWSATLKEWGYAGMTFDVGAALFSHISSHDTAKDIAGPIVILVLIAISYFGYAKVKNPALVEADVSKRPNI